ncbi:MAG TPA: hypothetical protein PKN85_10670 [Syntrophorhabdaceae bacterium]|nr:hypothetical protein [Syntrophorhabdaceae bacterium]
MKAGALSVSLAERFTKAGHVGGQLKLLPEIDALPNPKKKRIVTPAEEGASNHCIMENRSLMSRGLFDWPDEIFR